MKRIALAFALLASCAEPGREIQLMEGDFAFIEIKLEG